MSAVRLLITAEGLTEERFVRSVLAPHLWRFNVIASARSVITSRDKKAHIEYRGGLLDYSRAKRDIESWLKEDRNPDARFTTMLDLYALPDDFPGFSSASRIGDPYERVAALEASLADDIGDPRFFPYLQLHEFEALILADPQGLSTEYLEHQTQIASLVELVDREGDNPELIDDGRESAPSKRILREIPEYDKATSGPIVADRIGLLSLRQRCRHFDEWVSRLERLAG